MCCESYYRLVWKTHVCKNEAHNCAPTTYQRSQTRAKRKQFQFCTRHQTVRNKRELEWNIIIRLLRIPWCVVHLLRAHQNSARSKRCLLSLLVPHLHSTKRNNLERERCWSQVCCSKRTLLCIVWCRSNLLIWNLQTEETQNSTTAKWVTCYTSSCWNSLHERQQERKERSHKRMINVTRSWNDPMSQKKRKGK